MKLRFSRLSSAGLALPISLGVTALIWEYCLGRRRAVYHLFRQAQGFRVVSCAMTRSPKLHLVLFALLIILFSLRVAVAQNGRDADQTAAALRSWIALDAPPGWEHLATDRILKAMPGWRRAYRRRARRNLARRAAPRRG